MTVAGQTLGVFLFTDVVGSTGLWAEQADRMRLDLAVHDDFCRSVFADRGGRIFSTAGDSFAVAFSTPHAAVDAAVELQRLIGAHPWTVDGGLAVRIGIHMGEAQERNQNFYGPALNEAARIMSVSHGGQIVVSDDVARGVTHPMRPLGEHRLRDLDGRWSLHQVDVPGFETDHEPLASLGDFRSTLPQQRTRLIGREDDVDLVREAIHSGRLITLLGPGGAGKTRVAVEAAERSRARFPGGTFFVDLTKVADCGSVVSAFVDGVARAVLPERSPERHLFAELTGEPVLVVVDNCEHVVDEVAEFIGQLLVEVANVSVLATSRVVMDIDDEHVVPLPPLRTDSRSAAAVELFVERALAVDRTLDFDDAELTTITAIVTRLDGLPLAIELAAARIRTLTPAQILSNLDERFRLLVGLRRRDPRQQSLEATIAWSYDLLGPEEQQALRTLAVCAGPVTLDTAARLLGLDPLAAANRLESLLGKSLIHGVVGGRTTRGFRMLESMRVFGRGQLERNGEVEAAHLALEAALVPDHEEIARDYVSFSEAYCDWNERNALEATTRRSAASIAHRAERIESAAFIYVSATSPDEPGAHHLMLAEVRELRSRRAALSLSGRTALWVAQMWLQTFTFQLGDMVQTAIDALADLPDDDPSRRLFDAYRLMGSAVADAVSVIVETDTLIPALLETVDRPHDSGTALIVLARSMALLSVPDFVRAHEAARIALRWAAPGSGAYDAALAHLLWMEYTGGLPRGPELTEARALGVSHYSQLRVGVAAAIATDAPIERRAAEIMELARWQPLGSQIYDESQFIVAFAWLALEEQRSDRAAQLFAAFATIDPGSGTAGVLGLERLARAETGEPVSSDEMLLRFIDPSVHERLARSVPLALSEELAYWDERLKVSSTGTNG